MAPRLRSVVSRPTAQQLLGALVKAMRLRELLDTRIGDTTRKAFERGDRVRPQARTDYVYALAAVLVELGFPRPLGDDDSITSDEMVTLVAGAIGEYCIHWDECQSYFESYGPRATDPLLTCLPMLRLALQDLGVRVGLHGLARHHEVGKPLIQHGPSALVDGTAFIRFVRFLFRRRNMRRVDLHAEVFGESSYERWEAGDLPQNKNVERLAQALARDPADRALLGLELRAVIALVELWQWLADAGLPEPHRLELAQSFVEWAVYYTIGFVLGIDGTTAEKEATRLRGMLQGARYEEVGRGVAGLGRCATEVGFALDLDTLRGAWHPAIRRWHGFLDLETGAVDVRASLGRSLPAGWSDRDVVAWALVSFHLQPDAQTSVAPDSEDGTSRSLEARAAWALQTGHPDIAEQMLRVATRRFAPEPWLHIKLGEALEAQGKFREAEQELLIAIALDDSIQDAQLLLARIRLEDGRPEEALRALAAAEKIAPGNPVVAEFEGHALHELRRPEDALVAYVRSRQHNPRHLPGWQGEAVTLLGLARIREAEKAAKQAAHLGDAGTLQVVKAVKASQRRKRAKKR